MLLLQPLLVDSSCGYSGDGLAGAATSSAGAGPVAAVFYVVGPVGMARARVQVVGLGAIVLGALVLVGDSEEDGRAECGRSRCRSGSSRGPSHCAAWWWRISCPKVGIVMMSCGGGDEVAEEKPI